MNYSEANTEALDLCRQLREKTKNREVNIIQNKHTGLFSVGTNRHLYTSGDVVVQSYRNNDGGHPDIIYKKEHVVVKKTRA